MYDLIGYGDMIADRVRTDAFARALRNTITADSVVLDIGTGTGLFALLACGFGARHVYAIEPDETIALARDIARVNGYANRITFIQNDSQRVSLPEPADIIVSDLRGVLPLYERSVQTLLDARQRLLAPGGVMIPLRDLLMVSLVDAPNLYAKHTQPWGSRIHGIDMRAAQRYLSNTWHKGRLRPEQLLLAPKPWGELDYATLTRPALSGNVNWTATRSGTAHGLGLWFDSELAAGVALSNAPELPELIYGNAFFPLSEPVAIAGGDRISLSIRADLVSEEYIWTWNTRICAGDSGNTIKADFKQSSFYSLPALQSQLHKRTASHRPALSEDGRIALFILELMNKNHTLENISRSLCRQYPERFPHWHAALDRVGAFSGEFSDTPQVANTSTGTAASIVSNMLPESSDG